MCAYAEARKVLEKEQNRPNQGSPADMVVLSMGTGLPKASFEYDDVKDWGLSRWARPLLDMAASASAETVDYQLKQLYKAASVPKQYLRFNPKLPVDVKPEMDNVSPENLRALKELGEYVAEEHEEKIDAFIELLIAEETVTAN
jgi:hypothetical protein